MKYRLNGLYFYIFLLKLLILGYNMWLKGIFMINTSVNQLIEQLNEAQLFLKKNKLNVEQKLILSNYIGNLYRTLICLGKTILSFDRNKVFGGYSNYRKVRKKIDNYSRQLISNFVVNKDFHRNYFGSILPEIEDELSYLCFDDYSEVYFSRSDFFDIMFQFMKSIGKYDLFEKMYKNGNIYSVLIGQDEGNVGFTLFNPLENDADIFLKDVKYTLSNMNTLAHEFGHVDDLLHNSWNAKKYNRYMYISFYGEVISRLYERMFMSFLLDNNIHTTSVKDLKVEFELMNHDYLLEAYILSLFSDKSIYKEEYLDCSFEDIMSLVKGEYTESDYMKSFIDEIISLDLSEIYNYAYGDIISLFLFDSISKHGFSNDLIEEFYNNRSRLFSESFFDSCGFDSKKYIKLYRKDIAHLKK